MPAPAADSKRGLAGIGCTQGPDKRFVSRFQATTPRLMLEVSRTDYAQSLDAGRLLERCDHSKGLIAEREDLQGMRSKNIFSDLEGANLVEEFFEQLAGSDRVRIERIVSLGHSSPEGFWYDQEQNEWVLLLQGRARLLFAEADEVVDLGPGDWISIPAHAKHRVVWTTPDEKTIWLAVHHP